MFSVKYGCVVSLFVASFVNAGLLSSFLRHRELSSDIGRDIGRRAGPCQVGWYYDTTSGQCTMCGPGYYCPDQASRVICPAGYYCNGQGLSFPSPCQPGRYAPTTGYAQQCDNCPAGRWNNAYGSTTCCTCCENSFNANTGQTHCQACAQGSAPPGASACTGNGPVNPVPPAWCTSSAYQSTDVCPVGASPVARRRAGRRSIMSCPNIAHKNCPVMGGRGGYECVDVQNDLESCGGCMDVSLYEGGGIDCTAIPGVLDVSCRVGKCVVSRCAPGFQVAGNGTTCAQAESMFGGEVVFGRF